MISPNLAEGKKWTLLSANNKTECIVYYTLSRSIASTQTPINRGNETLDIWIGNPAS